jgi:hypothetical protein
LWIDGMRIHHGGAAGRQSWRLPWCWLWRRQAARRARPERSR